MTISHVIYLEFARLIVSWQWVTEVKWTPVVTCCRDRLTLDGTKLTILTMLLTEATPVPIAAIHHWKTLAFACSLDIKIVDLYMRRSAD